MLLESVHGLTSFFLAATSEDVELDDYHMSPDIIPEWRGENATSTIPSQSPMSNSSSTDDVSPPVARSDLATLAGLRVVSRMNSCLSLAREVQHLPMGRKMIQ